MRRMIAILMTVVLLLPLNACSNNEKPAATTGEITESEGENKASAETRIVKGSDGVEVEIPFTITKAAPLIGSFAQITEMLTAGGGKIAAAATKNIGDTFKKFFPDYAESNANDYNSTSVEDLIASGAQVAYGPTSVFSDDQLNQLKNAGIPYVPVDNINTVDGICSAFLIIGEILGEEAHDRAQGFVDYYQGNISLCKERTADIAEAEKITVLVLFYSADSYTTTNGKDISNVYIEAAGGVNVAADYSTEAGHNDLAVDAEQIIAWNPQFIMARSQAVKEAVLSDPALATVDAVVSGNIQVCPYGVYPWCVRNGEGSMLPLWFGVNLYPTLYEDIDMKTIVKDFFNNWYNYDISEKEISDTLEGEAG